MQETLTRLHLEPGDVLLVRHPDTLDFLTHCGLKLDFNVPLVFAPGGLTTLKRADLLNLLEQLEASETPASSQDSQGSAANGVAQ